MGKERVGFIGLGIMGKPMAKNLVDAGYKLHVYNRSRAAVDELTAYGATASASPKEVAQQADIVISIVTDTPDVEEIALGKSGIFEGARDGLIHVDMSTISPTGIQALGDKAAPHGIGVVDAPVSGGQIGAENGTLSIMAGGNKDHIARCMPLFEVMGENIVHVGDLGSGQLVKLCNQIICGLNLVATCEGLALAARAGVDIRKTYNVVTKGAAGSWALENLGKKMIDGDFAPAFMTKLQQKDLRLALETATDLQLPLPGTGLTQQLLRALEAAGEEKNGTQALIKVYETLGHFTLS